MEALIVKIGAIGDVIMAMPMARELKRRDPSARLTWVCAEAVAPLVRATGLVDRVITVREKRLYGPWALGRFWEVLRVWARLLGRRFDRIFVAYRDARYRWMVAPVARKELLHLGGSTEASTLVEDRYHGDEYARVFFGEVGERKRPLPYPEFKELPPAPVVDGIEGPMVALAPGGAVNFVREEGLRRWPIESYVQLARELSARGITVVITGAPSDEWVRPHFEGVARVDLVGQTGLLELVAVYRRCDAVVTHDSGPLHLTKLAGTPVIGLFGPTRPAEKLREAEGSRILWGGAELPCRPCYDGRNYADCSSNLCMQGIAVKSVVERVQVLVKGKSA